MTTKAKHDAQTREIEAARAAVTCRMDEAMKWTRDEGGNYQSRDGRCEILRVDRGIAGIAGDGYGGAGVEWTLVIDGVGSDVYARLRDAKADAVRLTGGDNGTQAPRGEATAG